MSRREREEFDRRIRSWRGWLLDSCLVVEVGSGGKMDDDREQWHRSFTSN